MDGIYQILGVNFYVLPSSVHEVMIFADNGNYDADKLSALIESINESEVTRQDILADEVFYYDAQEGRLISGKEQTKRSRRLIISSAGNELGESLESIEA